MKIGSMYKSAYMYQFLIYRSNVANAFLNVLLGEPFCFIL